MKQLSEKILYAALGVAGGLSGLLAAANCTGRSCGSCYGCVGGGALIVAAAAVNRFKSRKNREVDYGVAESDH